LTKKKRRSTGSASSRKRKPNSKSSPSLVIPIVVGLVVVAVIVGAIISIENRRATAATVSGGGLATAQPLDTSSIPFPTVPRISLQETGDRLGQGEAVLVDVRSRESYDKAHAAGAMSFPEEEVDARLDTLPRDKDLVLY